MFKTRSIIKYKDPDNIKKEMNDTLTRMLNRARVFYCESKNITSSNVTSFYGTYSMMHDEINKMVDHAMFLHDKLNSLNGNDQEITLHFIKQISTKDNYLNLVQQHINKMENERELRNKLILERGA